MTSGVFVKSFDARTYDLVCLGEALVDFLPSRTGPLETVPSFERHPGGAPANVAVGAACLGARAALVGCVGDDPFGRAVSLVLREEGVETRWLRAVPGTRTGLAFVALDEAGVPRFHAPLGDEAAELALSLGDVDAVPFDDVRVVHVTTSSLRSASAREATFACVQRARAAGCVVTVDPNLRLHQWSDVAPLVRDLAMLWPLVDVVKLSAEEAAFCTGTTDALAAAQRLVDAGPALAVVTRGPAGCAYVLRTEAGLERGVLPARAAHVVDTTGAGDAFMASLAHALSRGDLTGFGRPRVAGAAHGRPLVSALAEALEAATQACEHVGAVSAWLARRGTAAGRAAVVPPAA
jgi:fructokinase